jgi:anhydro-N-acetylmuramic acid kinase
MKALSPDLSFKMDSKLIESKEAMAFAFLGLMKMKNQTNVLSSVTGSVKDHCSGKIFPEEL